MLCLLRQLRTEYRIALVTDNKSDRIRTILECNNLDDFFDAVAVSAELGSGKTDRRIFDYVLEIFPGSWHSWKRRLPDDFQTIRKFGCKKRPTALLPVFSVSLRLLPQHVRELPRGW